MDTGNKTNSDVQISELRAFLAVVDEKSFSAAATKLGTSQPAVSQRIKSLEGRLGANLLKRRGVIAPTELGHELYHRVTRIVADIDDVAQYAARTEALDFGNLRLGFSTPHIAMRVLGEFRHQHPKISVDLFQRNSWTLLESLKSCDYDVAVLTLDDSMCAGFSCKLLVPQKLVAIVSQDHPFAKLQNVDWSNLTDTTLIMQKNPSMTRTSLDREFWNQGIAPTNILEVPRRETLRDAVLAGLGVGFIFDEEIGSDPRLVRLDLPFQGDSCGVYVATLPGANRLPVIDRFITVADTIYAGRHK